MNEQKSSRRMPLLLRGCIIFSVFALLYIGLWWFSLHHYGNVAVFCGDDAENIKTDLIYEDKTYHLAAAVGSYGVSSGKFVKSDELGEVKPVGKDALSVSYLVYQVKNSKKQIDERYLIVVYGDGVSYVYYLDGEENPYKGEEPTYSDDKFDEYDDE